MIDLHCHVLPGIDDGPDSIEDSLGMARSAVAAGIRTIVATPHVSSRYDNTATTIAAAAAALRQRLAAGGVELELLAGAEVALTKVAELEDSQLAALRLGGSQWLLLEPPFSPVAGALEGVVASLQGAGHRILLAHPERCPAIQRHPDVLERLVLQGVLSSVTAGSLTGQFGSTVRALAMHLIEEGLVHNVASDAHDNTSRPPEIARALQRAGLGELTQWFCEDVPAAILAGDEHIPVRPDIASGSHGRRPSARRWLGLRRG